jgi:hypothetical protein
VVPVAAQGFFWGVSGMPLSVLIRGCFNSLSFFSGLISTTLILTTLSA